MAARRSARNSPCAHKAQEGVKGGTLAGGSPFAGGPAARSPCDSITPAVNERRAVEEPRPYGGRRNVVRSAMDEGKGRRGRRPLRVATRSGRVPLDLQGAGRGVGTGENAATGGVLISFVGRRGRRPLQGGCGDVGGGGRLAPSGDETPPLRGGGGTRWGRR